MEEINLENLEQGNVKCLFPFLGTEVIANGCICIILGFKTGQLYLEIKEPFKSGQKIGVQFWTDGFLVEKYEHFLTISKSTLTTYLSDNADSVFQEANEKQYDKIISLLDNDTELKNIDNMVCNLINKKIAAIINKSDNSSL